MSKNKVYIIVLITYILNIFALLIFYNIDVDFKMTQASFINIFIIFTTIFLFALILTYYLARQVNKVRIKQIEVFENDDYLIDEYQNDRLINLLYERNFDLKQKIINLNEEQNKWVHDIKIPLATLKLFIENHRNSLEVNDINLLDIIALEIESDINKKIMYDKIELEIDDFNIEQFNLNKIINETIRKFKPSFLLKNLAVNLNMESIMVNSDAKRIRYCLEQVISNAIKYSYENTTINIYMVASILIIENKGDTIDSQDSKRIFEHGYTGKNSNVEDLASTGIGLYMVKKSLEHLNHSISIDSDESLTKVMIDFKKVTKM